MKYNFLTYCLLGFTFLTACTTDEDVSVVVFPSDENWQEEHVDGPSVTVKRFDAGDDVSRSSIYYDGQSLIFGWNIGDKIGLYPTAKDMTDLPEEEGLLSQTEYPHPSLSQNSNMYRTDPLKASQTRFSCLESSSQTSHILKNGSSDFVWDEASRWSTYFPYKEGGENENYEKRIFSFKGQKQSSLVDLGAYFDAQNTTDKQVKAQYENAYHLSEVAACQHLGQYDVMISPETQWLENGSVNFQMRHVGAIARVYLKALEENLIVKNVKLICEKPIFYEDFSFTLFSHPYNESQTDFGVDLDRESGGCQITPEGDPVKMIQLEFTNDCITTKTGVGKNYGPYVVAYFMMYPITYTPATDGDLFAYVTAYKKDGNPADEVHFVSEPLTKKTMKSGKYYQWTSSTHPDDGLYPIELTATLLPWQEIVGAGIETDLEK